MKNQVDVLFVHGGPGLNSRPEELAFSQFLEQQSIKAHFWNEPSNLRSGGDTFQEDKAYSNWLDSLQNICLELRPKIVVAISFGAQGVAELLGTRLLDFRPSLVLVSPTLDINDTMTRMMGFSKEDFKVSDPERYQRISENITSTKSFWDTEMKNGVALAWENPRLALHYISDMNVLQSWGSAMSEPLYQVDNLSQDKIFEDFRKLSPLNQRLEKPIATKTTVVVGEDDRLCPEDFVKQTLKPVFESFKVIKYKGVKHFPHLEKPNEFVQLLKTLL